MRRNSGRGILRSADTHESDFLRNRKGAEPLGFGRVRGGQRKPHPCPQDCLCPGDARESLSERSLGEPLDIDDVALLLGCSPWTVRQKYLPQGLPHLRASASGKFVFFREQIVHWILERQEKGEWK
jgi:hypothetical protein